MPLREIKLATFAILFFVFQSFAQQNTADKENIGKHLEDYFFLDRENIHIQFNKNTYLTNENIWFKGYVYHRKKKLPFYNTTNVYATIYDDNGTKIKECLLFTSNGSFTGNFELNDSFKSGKYYVHFFTNWMNNFKENESSVVEIQIINNNEKTFLLDNKIDYSKANIDFYPEGGTIIKNVQNSIGIKISDCNGKPIPISEVEILDHENKLIQKVAINKFGLGKFLLLADKNAKVSCLINGEKIEINLPLYSDDGISLEINNYSLKDKTIAKIRINENKLEAYKTKKTYLLVHQDEKFNIFDIDFSNNNPEQTILFPNENLFDGVNSIRIIDENKKQIAERLVFKYPNNFLKFEFNKLKTAKDTIVFKANSISQNSNVSISILPETSLASNFENTLFSSFLISPYLSEKCLESNYYFEGISKLKHHAIDLFLMNQKSGKYKWDNITGAPPKSDHPFDFGISLKGTLNQTLKDSKKFRVKLYSIKAEINESTEINSKNEFFFNNLILADSTWVNFTLVNEKNQSTQLKLYPQILNGRRIFNKPFIPIKKDCESFEKVEHELPSFFNEAITLNQVDIKIEKKKALKHSKTLGNGNLRGFKVDEKDNTEVLDYIRNNGFEVPSNTSSLTVQIFGRSITTLNGARNTPVLFIDGLQQMNFDLLLNMKMNEIDEIYLNPNAIVASVNNNQGIIKIYRRTSNILNNPKSDAKPFEIKNAFSKIEPFKNIIYTSTESKGFQNFGVINWIPALTKQLSGEFTFNTPHMNQKKVKVLIEGFTADGHLISEIRTIDLQ